MTAQDLPFPGLLAAVQRNCDISDAQYARNDSICVYLMRMRGHYRWIHGLLDQRAGDLQGLGHWLDQRERYWDSLEESPLQPVPIGDHLHDPYDDEAINRALMPHGLIYGGGLGLYGKPSFFVADLQQNLDEQGVTIHLCGREHARDLLAPAAMSAGSTVYIRRQALQQLLLEKREEWLWKKMPGPLQRAFAHYPFERQPEQALKRMADAEVASLIQHELGEIDAGRLLGESWQQMLLYLCGSPLEKLARALRDLLADCLCTLPDIIAERHQPRLHFYMGNLSGFRKALFPQLQDGYRQWLEQRERWAALEDIVGQGQRHWRQCADQLLRAHRSEPLDGASATEWLERCQR